MRITTPLTNLSLDVTITPEEILADLTSPERIAPAHGGSR
jgi:hypothetical protein